MKDALHRILSGSPLHRRELIAAGFFVLLWFAMDVVQFADWVNSKVNPPAPTLCVPASNLSSDDGILLRGMTYQWQRQVQ